MFYSQVILAKKGPLAKVWLAAHWGDKKLARPQIFATDISQSCTDIMNPSVPLALRLSGHLLLGVVRIYSRKVKYVLNDCTEAMLKLQMAFTKQANTNALDGGKGSGIDQRELLSDKDAPTHQLVANFGEYDQVHVVEGFCLPLPEDNEWILAEDVDDVEGGGAHFRQSQTQSQLLQAHLPTRASGGRTGQISPDPRGGGPDHRAGGNDTPEEETWAPFDPDDDEERSHVSDIELVRAANDSMLSEDRDQTRRSMLSEDGVTPLKDGTTPGGGPPQQPNEEDDMNDFNVPFEDESDDEQQQPPGSGVAANGGMDFMNLDISRDESGATTPGSRGLGLGLDDVSAASSNKRHLDDGDGEGTKKPRPRQRRRKRRKVIIDNNETELTNEFIRQMLGNTDDIVRTMIHPATIWDEEGLGRDYKTLVMAREGIVLPTAAGGGKKNKKSTTTTKDGSTIPSLTRPFLADEGANGGPNLHPDLLKLWQDNYWKVLGQPCPYERDDDDAQENVDDIEEVRRGTKADDDSEVGSQQLSVTDPKQSEQEQNGDAPPLDDEDEFNMPPPDDDDEEEEPMDMPLPDFAGDDEEEQNNLVDKSQDEIDMLELGMVNDMVLDSDQDDDDDDAAVAGRQAIGDVASSTVKWHKHTVRVFQHLKKCMKDTATDAGEGGNDDDDDMKDLPEQILFKQLTKNVTSRRNAASVFFEMLQLKTWDYIDLDQHDAYGDITISPGIRFSESPPN